MTKKKRPPFVDCITGFINDDEPELSDEMERDVELLTEVFMQQKKDRDEITVAKSIFDEIVEFTEHEDTPEEARAKKGGKARAKKLSAEERSAIAKKAAESRWKK